MAAELNKVGYSYPNAEGIPDGDFRNTCRGCKLVTEGAVLPAPPVKSTPTSCSEPAVELNPTATQAIVDLYRVLDIHRTATSLEVKKGYRKLAAEWHPDKFTMSAAKSREYASEQFVAIAEAFEVLVDPERRRIYDDTGRIHHVGNPILVCSHCQLPTGRYAFPASIV